jgi:hypothetical protein
MPTTMVVKMMGATTTLIARTNASPYGFSAIENSG